MQIKKLIGTLKKYFEAARMSVRFYYMMLKMNRLRADSTENRQGMLWRVLCSLMSVHGIYIYINGNVEMMEGNIRGIKTMTEGAGVMIMAATLKQYGGVLVGAENERKKED